MCVSFCRALPTMSHTERSLYIRNLITHNRGVVNQFFFAGLSCGLGAQIVFEDCSVVAKILGTFVYRARQLDLRVIGKFKLKTLSQIPGPRVVTK